MKRRVIVTVGAPSVLLSATCSSQRRRMDSVRAPAPRGPHALALSDQASMPKHQGPRDSRRRFSKANTQGRSRYLNELMEKLKRHSHSRGPQGEPIDVDRLHPRLKLDILRRTWVRHKALAKAQRTSHLPRFRSVLFNKKYFFQEEDLHEDFTKGRGPGGQATNRRMQTVILHHRPSGIVIRHSKWPSLWLNRRAARDLLDLRLEEQLIGPSSTLGMERRALAKRAVRTKKQLRKLRRRGEALQRIEVRQPNFCDILCGNGPFPDDICHQICSIVTASTKGNTAVRSSTTTPVTSAAPFSLSSLFNAQCHMWWPILHAVNANGCLPRLLSCIFPVVPCAMWFDWFGLAMASAADERIAYERLQRCRQNPTVLANVRLALSCFLETFGLMLTEQAPSGCAGAAPPKPRLLVCRDASRSRDDIEGRWAEVQAPFALRPMARLALPHIFVSLVQLGARPEAAALKRFVVREAQGEKGSVASVPPPAWAVEALSLLNDATREFIGQRSIPPTEAFA